MDKHFQSTYREAAVGWELGHPGDRVGLVLPQGSAWAKGGGRQRRRAQSQWLPWWMDGKPLPGVPWGAF